MVYVCKRLFDFKKNSLGILAILLNFPGLKNQHHVKSCKEMQKQWSLLQLLPAMDAGSDDCLQLAVDWVLLARLPHCWKGTVLGCLILFALTRRSSWQCGETRVVSLGTLPVRLSCAAVWG